jgi:glycerol-3-phosphate dehydrogenase subunit B
LSDFKADVAVIGSGIAGLTAAKQIARRHERVTVFSKAYGATAISSGVMDVANPTIIRMPPDTPNDLLRKKYAPKPNHPYSLILKREQLESPMREEADSSKLGNTIQNAISQFVSGMASVGYPMEGTPDHNMIIINSIGSVRSTCLAPPSVARGDLSKIHDGRIFFVCFKGNSDYDSKICCQNFNSTKGIIGLPIESLEDGHASIGFPGLEDRSTLLSIELARNIEREEGVAAKVGKKIREVSKDKGATHICLPPCIGLRKVEDIMKIIAEETGLTPFECVNLTPPSILGYRLQLALDDLAAKSNIPVMIPYEATGFEAEGKTIKRIKVTSGERSYKIEAERFILATGSFVGGGIVEKDGAVKEPLFNLPLSDENGREVNGTFVRTMLSNEAIPIEGHAVFSIGVKVDKDMRPVSAGGEPVYNNLFACGNILSGFSHTSSGSRHGVAIATGYVAGEEASKT